MQGFLVAHSVELVLGAGASKWRREKKVCRRLMTAALLCGVALLPLWTKNIQKLPVSTVSGSLAPRDPAPPVSEFPSQPQLVQRYGKLALSFEPNLGQADLGVKFLARGSGYSLFLTSGEAVLAFKSSSAAVPVATAHRGLTAVASDGLQTSIRMMLIGADPAPTIRGVQALPGKSHYFIGNDPNAWVTNIPNYAKVEYQGVYPGVNLVYYGNQRQLEYDFVISPGTDPKVIALRFAESTLEAQAGANSAAKLHIDESGDLVIGSGANQIHFRKPIVYQNLDSARSDASSKKFLAGSYSLSADNRVSFDVPEFDRTKPLIIDPVLTYSTYLGGLGTDAATSIAVDSAGNAYLAGTTTSLQFPTSAGAYQPVLHDGPSCTGNSCGDAFISKIDPTGSTLLFSTYLGGSGQDIASAIAVDASGNSYITGSTNSPDFPTVSPLQPSFGGGSSDGFVAKIGPTGSTLIYSTYLGGNDLDQGAGIAVDASGDAYVVGGTQSANFAASSSIGKCQGGGVMDAFVTKLNAAGNATVFSTCFGGSSVDRASAIVLDSSDNMYIAGWTSSSNFPTTSRAFQGSLKGSENAFVLLLSSSGSSIPYSSFLGGSGSDQATGVAIDSVKNIYITGSTTSANFPVTAGAAQTTYGGGGDSFVAKFNTVNSGSASLVYLTFIGGSGNDVALGIAVDLGRNAYVAGYTSSSNFPMVSPIQSAFGGGGTDAFVFQINPQGSALLYSTYLGGSGSEDSNGWGNIAIDAQGSAYIVGSTTSSDFPIVSATAFQPNNAGGTDAFLSKVGALSTPIPGLTLLWPLPKYQNRGITQENYSELNYAGNKMYHTGLSLLAPAGTLVGAAAAGDVVLIQLNPPKGSSCYDHGYGNTVFVQHTLPSGEIVYSQYSHLLTIDSTIQSQCGTANSQYAITCSVPVPVTALQSLGTVGHTACGYSDTNPSDTHLHLELKNFLALTAAYGPGGAGYVLTPPDEYGLYNPMENLNAVSNLPIAIPVLVTGSSAANLLTGPGGGAGTAYRTINQVATGTVLDARRIVTGATTTPTCSSGWYEVSKIDGTLFDDTFGNGTGQMLYGWICADQVTPAGSTPPPQPVLSVSTTTLGFSAVQGSGTSPAPAYVTVSNVGSGTVSFTATSDSAWLSVSPASGSAPPSQSLQVSAALGSLTAGTYTGHITVTDPGVQGSPATITVTFTISAPPSPVLTLSTSTLSFSATQGSGTNPAPANVTVSNTGGGSLSFTASSDSAWLSVSPASGSAPPSQSLQISATLGSLAANTYTGHITVTASGALGSPGVITVTFVVSPPPPPPALSLSTTTLSFGATQGTGTNPPPANVTASNTGSGTLSFTASSDSAWLAVSPTSGSAPPSQSLQISATLGGLTAGTYTGHITVTASGALGSPGVITVTFFVSPPPPPAPPGGFFIRGGTKEVTSAATTIALGYSGEPQQGDLLVAYVWWNSTSAAVSSVADGCGNTWVATAAQSDSVDNTQAQLFYVAGSKPCSSVPTVTVTFVSAVSSRLILGDWSGVGAGAVYYDTGSTNFTASTTTPVSSVANTNAQDLLIQVAAANSASNKFTSGGAFTNLESANGLVLAGQTVSAAQSYSTSLTSSATDNELSGIFAFQLTAAPAFPVQSSLNSATATTISCSLPQNVKQGDLLAAYIWWQGNSTVTMSLADNINGTWSAAGGQATETVLPHSSQLFYFANTGAGTVTITATPSNGTSQPMYLECVELAGMATSNVLDGTPATASISSKTVTSLNVGPVTTSNSNDLLLLGCATNAGNRFNIPTGFTQLQAVNHATLSVGPANSAGSYSTTCSGGGAYYTGNLAAFQ